MWSITFFYSFNYEYIVDGVSDHLIEQTASRSLLNLTYCIDSTDVSTGSKSFTPNCRDFLRFCILVG